VITAHQRYGQTDRRTSSDPMTATLLKHVAVKMSFNVGGIVADNAVFTLSIACSFLEIFAIKI